ncbi:MAG: N-acetylneuraminate synthase family protein [Spirochaetaceae bacterium]|jgi:sialic acid synthase SpsE|nr:N-acetylneuraminate synthase family protein [Spirochaetaceae bacterium]
MRQKTFIIAEIGTAHQGNIKKAEKLIQAATECGADCAKFQVVFADEIIHPLTGTVPLPGGETPLYEVFRELEQDLLFYKKLKTMTEKAGMTFMASPFGLKSAAILKEIGSKIYKIASPELNHYPLLKEVSSYGEKIILSTGVSTLGDIEEALNITGRKNTAILHCITAYPAPPEQYNLSLIPLYRQIFGVETGISDHTTDPVLVPVISTALGATIIEKHFTLSNTTEGLDDPIALNPKNFKLMVDKVRYAEESDSEEILNQLKSDYSSSLIEKIIGSGEKKLAPAEKENYGRTNRSLHALVGISEGTILTKQNCALLRTEKILHPGLSPIHFELVLGKKVTRQISNGEGIMWHDLL